jgi:hypothetical protein
LRTSNSRPMLGAEAFEPREANSHEPSFVGNNQI